MADSMALGDYKYILDSRPVPELSKVETGTTQPSNIDDPLGDPEFSTLDNKTKILQPNL